MTMYWATLYYDELGVFWGLVGWFGWFGLIIEKAEITIFQIYRFLARSLARSLTGSFSRSFHLSAIIKAPWKEEVEGSFVRGRDSALNYAL